MSLEFDPRTGFAQREDKLGELLVPRKSSFLPPSPGKQAAPPSSLVGVGCDDLHADWDRYALEYPPGLVLIPGKLLLSISDLLGILDLYTRLVRLVCIFDLYAWLVYSTCILG